MSELEIWNELGNIYYNSGAYDEAIRAYHRAIELDHGNGQSFSNLASIYIRKEFFTEAILMYQKGIELLKNPSEKAELWNHLGDVYLHLDRFNEAIQAYQTAVNLDPGNETFNTDLAKVRLGSTQAPFLGGSINQEAVYIPADPTGEVGTSEAVLELQPEAALIAELFEGTAEPVSEPSTVTQNSTIPAPVNLASDETPAPFIAPFEPALGSADSTEAASLSSALLPGESVVEPVAIVDLPAESGEAAGSAPETERLPQELLACLLDPDEPAQEANLDLEAFSDFIEEHAEGLAPITQETLEMPVEQAASEPVPDMPEAPTAIEFPEPAITPAADSLAASDLSQPSTVNQPEMVEPATAVAALADAPSTQPDLPKAQTASSPSESPCWVFKTLESPTFVETEDVPPAEETPLILGSRLFDENAPGETASTENPESIQGAGQPAPSDPALEVIDSAGWEEPASIQGEPAKAADSILEPGTDSTPEPEIESITQVFAAALPDDFEIPFNLGRTEKDLPAIEPQMGEPMKSRASALLNLGLLHWHRSDFEGSVQFLKTALNLAGVFFDHPFEALCFHALALVETDLGNTDEAILAYEKSACLDPEHFSPWKDIGSLYSKTNRYAEALDSFKKAIEHNPNDSLSWNGLGDVYHKLGRTEDAVAAYQLGNVFDRAPRENNSRKVNPAEKVSHEQTPRVLEEMGNINFLNSAYDDAIRSYSDAIELMQDPSDQARLWRRLGDTYQRLDENDNASAAYQKAANLDSANLPLQVPEPRSESNPAGDITASAENSETQVAEAAEEPVVEFAGTDQDLPSDEKLDGGLQPAIETEPLHTDEPESPEAGEDPDAFVPLPEPMRESETEAAYWFFKTSAPARHASEPEQEAPRITSRDFKLTNESGLGNVKPSPSFVLPKYSSQARLDKPLLADEYGGSDVMVLEEDPRADDPTPLGTLLEANESLERLETFSRRETESVPVEELEILAEEASSTGSCVETEPVLDQLGTDIHTLENDITAYRRVTELNPSNDRAWDALGNMYEAVGLHSEAIDAFNKAISLASQREVYHYHLGLAHAAQKQYDRAIQALQKVVAINPDFILAHCALAGYYRRMGKEAEAREHIVIARPYMEAENYYNQACFESICGNADRALTFLKNALDKKQVQLDLVRSDPDLDFIRTDARFDEMMNRKGDPYQPVPAE